MFRPGPPLDRLELPERFDLLDVEVDLAGAQARRGGAPLALEPKAFDLLLLLAANPGRVIEKQEIFERIWPDAVVTDNALARVVAHLRRELGDEAESPRFVATVRTRGYRGLPAPRAQDADPGADSPEVGVAGRRGFGVTLAAAGAVALSAAILLAFVRSRPAPSPGPAWRPNPVQRTFALGYQGGADFSPDGSQIVYSSDAAGGLELFVEPLDGGVPRQLTEDGGPKVDAAWSPDGRLIAYRDLGRGGLWLVAPSGGPPRQLTAFGSQPAWFPDSERLVFASPGRPTLGPAEWPATSLSSLFLVDVGTGRVTTLTEPNGEQGGHGTPSVSVDSREVYFATGRSGRGGSRGAIWRVPSSGGLPERLTPTPAEGEGATAPYWYDPTPHPSGDSLLAIEAGTARRIVRIWLDGSRRIETILEAAPSGTSELALSARGDRVVYNDIRTRSSLEEVEIDAEERIVGPARTLEASATTRALRPQYAPDGERLAFYRRRPGVPQSVVVFTLANGETLELSHEMGGRASWLGPTRLEVGVTSGSGFEVDLETGLRAEKPPAPAVSEALRGDWAPALAYAAGEEWVVVAETTPAGKAALVRGDLRTGARRELTEMERPVSYPVLSPDRLRVVFEVKDDSGLDNELWQVPVAGGRPERLPTASGSSWLGGFAPDGDRVVYAAHREGTWWIAVAGLGKPERRLDVPPETLGYLRWPDWSPDGRHIAYERMHYEANLWTLDLAGRR